MITVNSDVACLLKVNKQATPNSIDIMRIEAKSIV